MKDLIKVRINDNLFHKDERVWYVNQQGCEFMVKDKGEYFKLPYIRVFIPKSDCTVLDSDSFKTEQGEPEPNTEYVPECSQTDELYRHMFDEHDLNFSTQDLKKIIEIANRSRLKPVQVDTPIGRDTKDIKVGQIVEVHEVPYFRKMKVESGWIYNFYDTETDNYSKEWIFVPEHHSK